jgi:hypothetical protein
MSWQEQAACRGKPTDWWFPNIAGKQRSKVRVRPEAMALCAACPVASECETAGKGWVGIWGGKINTMAGYAPRESVNKCGTIAGYARHKRAEEPACRACKDANTVYHRILKPAAGPRTTTTAATHMPGETPITIARLLRRGDQLRRGT